MQKKVTFFETAYEIDFKVYFILCIGSTETQNQDLRPLSDSFRDHKSKYNLRIGKQAFVENRIFEVNNVISVCVKFQYLDIRRSVLETEHTSGLVLTSRV